MLGSILLIALVGIVLCFCLVVLFGAPYVPTLRKQIESAMELAQLKPGDTLLELGCGDGRLLLAAAERGWKVVGYELNPLLVLVCIVRTWRYRQLVQVRWGNFMTQQLPPAQAIFIFGIAKLMPALDKKIVQSFTKPVKLISFAFEIPGKPAKQEKDGLFLYLYP